MTIIGLMRIGKHCCLGIVTISHCWAYGYCNKFIQD
jgi:hypothetical protein